MTVKRKNGNRPYTLVNLSYGVLIATIFILATLSIKLKDFENYFIEADTWHSLNNPKEIWDDDTDMKTNTTDTASASPGETSKNNSSKNLLGNTIDNNYNQENAESMTWEPILQGKKLLEVVWLMSFPNSGTTFTNHLIQGYTNTTTATNYGQEQSTTQETISILPGSQDGPFFRYSSWPLPPRYILTKTHCGGECDACQTPGSNEYINSVEAFEQACCTGKRISNKTKIPTTYSSDIPKKAIHLIRDPFDNVVARLHLKERRWERQRNKTKYEERVDMFNRTKDGFLAYCRFRDLKSFKLEYHQRTLRAKILELAMKVPCYAEFVSYTRWHNHAIQLVAQKDIPTMTLFYEDYALQWNTTVDQLLSFLWLKPAPGAEAEEFILGKHYDEFYSEEQKQAAANLIQEIASAELWELLQRYVS